MHIYLTHTQNWLSLSRDKN